MPITEDRIGKLREFGLSEYAARAYLALLDLGLTEARDISTLSKVPTSKIYHILEQLHERGLCIILPEFPKKYAPVPFSEYLDKLQSQHEEAARAIDRDRDNLSDMFAVAGDVDVGDRGTFTVLRGRRNVLSKISELTREARRELFVMGTRGSAARMKYYEEETRDAVERGVTMRFLVPLGADGIPAYADFAEAAEIRHRVVSEDDSGANVAIAIYDDERALIINFLPDDGHMYQGKDTAFYTDHEAMVAALRSIVDPHWRTARTFEARRREIEDGQIPEFAHVYTTEEQALERLGEAVRRGTNRVVALRGGDMRGIPRESRRLLERLTAEGVEFRIVTHVGRRDVAMNLRDLAASTQHLDVRHVDHIVPTRFWVLDDREAFFSITHAAGSDLETAEELMVHTSNPATVKALRAHFESVWATARPIEARADEIEAGGRAVEPVTRFMPATEASQAGSRAVIERARHEVRLLVRGDALAHVADSEPVRAAHARGVRVRVLSAVTKENAAGAERAAEFAEVRHVPRVTLLGNSSDGEEAFVVLPGTGRSSDEGRDWTESAAAAVRSTDALYVRGFDGFFDAQWDAAMPLDQRLAELGVAREPREGTREVPVK